MRIRCVGATALGLVTLGCFGNETTPFPPGLEPLEDVTAEAPAPRDGDPHPEELNLVTGETPRFMFVHARGYIHAPLSDVFAAMTTPEVAVDRRGVDRWSVTLDVEPDYDVSFRVRNEVDDVITVEFDVTWRFGVVEGDNERPETVAATFSKTWGTTFISIMRGSVVARELEPGVTEIELVEHLDAPGGVDPVVSYIRDLFNDMVAQSRGEPLPPL